MSVVAKGDRRRAALLESLDQHLREASLDSINIADISRQAGVTRSAFYFYFENKASAVAALMDEMYDDSRAAAGLLAGPGTPAENIEAMVRALFAARDRHEHLFRASLEARATSATVRDLWDSDRESFVPAVAALIESERPGAANAAALASVLLELNDRMLERLTLGGAHQREELVDAVVSIWVHTIYGELKP